MNYCYQFVHKNLKSLINGTVYHQSKTWLPGFLGWENHKVSLTAHLHVVRIENIDNILHVVTVYKQQFCNKIWHIFFFNLSCPIFGSIKLGYKHRVNFLLKHTCIDKHSVKGFQFSNTFEILVTVIYFKDSSMISVYKYKTLSIKAFKIEMIFFK